MEIGNEIGQKIRSAIKAKLVELGAYVDDELPDYIMVMVANRKTEEQMAEDLSLFLSSNTTKFTSWLHNLLEKLQSITTNESGAAAEAASSRSKPSLPACHPTTYVTQEPSLQQPLAAPAAKPSDSSHRVSTDVVTPPVTQPGVDEEPIIKLTPEHDEFEDEALVEKSTPISQSQTKSDMSASVADDMPGAKEPWKESRRISVGGVEPRKRAREEEYVPQTVSSGQTEVRKRLGAVTHQAPTVKYARMSSDAVSGRRALGSSVGAVLHHDVDEEEEGYDPHRPAIGNVASVIKVTERRSSVPVTLQANKSLLMKAMQQAEQSVAKARQHLISGTPVSVAAAETKPSERHVTKTVKSSQPISEQLTSTDTQRPAVSDDRTAALSGSDLRRSLMSLPASSVSSQVVRHSVSKTSISGVSAQIAGETVTEDSLDLMDQDDVESVDSEEDGLRQLLLLQQTNVKLGQRAGSPKFVVTLDGASESLTEMDTTDPDTLVPSSSASARNVVRVKPQTQPLATLEDVDDDGAMSMTVDTATKLHANERCKFWPACKNGDSCQFHHPTQPCKKFPACLFGDTCLFIHPNCKFDTGCRNPRCPYTHSCPRRPSTAPSAALPVIVQPVRMPVYLPPLPRFHGPRPVRPKQTRCKFFPRCTDMNCRFLHPKPCRYGLSCTSRHTSCPFSHPDLPDKQRMKWIAPKAGSSGSS